MFILNGRDNPLLHSFRIEPMELKNDADLIAFMIRNEAHQRCIMYNVLKTCDRCFLTQAMDMGDVKEMGLGQGNVDNFN